MPDIGEQQPLNPLYPVNPIRRPERENGSKQPERKQPKKKHQPPEGEDGAPHVDEFV